MTQMTSATANNAPNPPPELALDLLMPKTYAAPLTFSFGRAEVRLTLSK